MRYSLTFLFFFLSANLASAQPTSPGAPPSLKVVSKTDKDKGQIVFIEFTYRAVPVVRERVIVVNGKQVAERFTTTETVVEQSTSVVELATSRVITPDGKQLPIGDVLNRLTPNTVVAVSADSNSPAQTYLRALSAETLVIIPGPPAPVKK